MLLKISLNCLVEDYLQYNAIKKIVEIVKSESNTNFTLNLPLIQPQGKKTVEEKHRNLYQASNQFYRHIVVCDLDLQFQCPPDLIKNWNVNQNENFVFIICNREIEAWLLADRKNFAKFIGIQLHLIPENTETIDNPKEFIISLARRTRKKKFQDIIPIGNYKIGPAYNKILKEFIEKYWDPVFASNYNYSLKRAIEKIKVLTKNKDII